MINGKHTLVALISMAAFGNACSDKNGYKDAKGYKCSDWKGYNCDDAHDKYWYSLSDETDLMRNCQKTCGTCDGCFDDPNFRDAEGHDCYDWKGYDCYAAEEDYDYSCTQKWDLLKGCAKTCNFCEDSLFSVFLDLVQQGHKIGGSWIEDAGVWECHEDSGLKTYGGCSDVPSFTDHKGYTCSDWEGYVCAAAKEEYGYTQEEETALMHGCGFTCGYCRLEYMKKYGEKCEDDYNFKDERGYQCFDWESHDCTRADEDYNWYTAEGEKDLLRKCPVSCKQCEKFTPNPTPNPTPAPSLKATIPPTSEPTTRKPTVPPTEYSCLMVDCEAAMEPCMTIIMGDGGSEDDALNCIIDNADDTCEGCVMELMMNVGYPQCFADHCPVGVVSCMSGHEDEQEGLESCGRSLGLSQQCEDCVGGFLGLTATPTQAPTATPTRAPTPSPTAVPTASTTAAMTVGEYKALCALSAESKSGCQALGCKYKLKKNKAKCIARSAKKLKCKKIKDADVCSGVGCGFDEEEGCTGTPEHLL